MCRIAIMVVVYSLLSYYPPRNFLFEHPDTGEYGILESYEDHDHEEDRVDRSGFPSFPDRLLLLIRLLPQGVKDLLGIFTKP